MCLELCVTSDKAHPLARPAQSAVESLRYAAGTPGVAPAWKRGVCSARDGDSMGDFNGDFDGVFLFKR